MIGEIKLNTKSKESKKARRKSILDELDALEDDISISDNRPKKEKKSNKDKEEKKKKEEGLTPDEEEWLDVLSGVTIESARKKKKPIDVFDLGGTKKKRKRKKKDGEMTDYNKEFEQEKRLYDNLMRDQSKFTTSLQQRYDAMENTKSSARGVGKFTTDLIESINSARSLTLQIAKEKTNLKKTIADLTMKEKKEFGAKAAEGEDMGLAGSSMLKRLLQESSSPEYSKDIDIADGDINDIYDNINEDMDISDDDAEIGKYLEYESLNPTIYVCISARDNSDAYFMAKADDGTEIPDYPLPEMTPLKINRSTNIASDTYSRHYPIIWVE